MSSITARTATDANHV